uniref:Uncharacterized protein n=1 Tax=Accipiter nisus TaxID=211598 RepID=A0A8B9MRT2_9AVES
MYTRRGVYMFIHAYVRVCEQASHARLRVYAHLQSSTCMPAYMCVHVRTCVSRCMFARVCNCIRVCACTYAHVYTRAEVRV